MPGSLRFSTQLIAEEGASAVVGRCQYIDQENKVIYEASPTPMNVRLLEYWSNKLPQPGSIFKVSSLRKCGLLDTKLHYAFDQDLFHRLKKVGKIVTTGELLATYRWHSDSLSFKGSKASENESHMLRMKYARKWLAAFPFVWFRLYRGLARFIKPRLPITLQQR